MIIKALPFLAGSIAFIITIKFLLKKSNNGYSSSVKNFIAEESRINTTTKQFDKLSLNFVKANLDALPFKEYENLDIYINIIKKQDFVKRKANLEMVKLPINLSNTQLKDLVGINNFDKVSILETHFNGYIKALYDWANELFIINNLKDCEKVLLEAIRLEGDISQIYILLSNIYFEQNKMDKLLWLKNIAENYNLSLKEKILLEINKNIKLLQDR